MKLVIVESPNKKKTILKYLGQGWRVEASMGHICDLPKKEMGVAPPDFHPIYELSERGKVTVAELKRIADQAESIWLATDPDREGEAIAAHLARYLQADSVKRIQFNEITEQAIQTAISKPRDINHLLFDAQQARRVVDRLVGYQVSSSLSRKLDQRLSAGRVQSVAVRLVVERERAIRQFKGTKHFGARLHFKEPHDWFANWDTAPFVNEEHPFIVDKDLAEKVASVKAVRVISVEHKEVNRNAPPPFITTTLQKAASLVLGLNAEQTMSVAQSLFEAGLISYHRTDNPNFSKEAIIAARQALEKMGYAEHLPKEPNEWKAPKNAQEAHEAIRPTDFLKEEANLADEKAKMLYRLIRLRALACQLSPAIIKMSVISLQAQEPIQGVDSLPIYRCKGQTTLYQGWRLLVGEDQSEEKEEDNEEVALPVVSEGDTLLSERGEVLQLKTKSPKRYTEPALITKLEKEGIGRPSTYAAILSNIQQRKYVSRKGKVFYAEPVAELIVDALVDKFKFMEVAYTRALEDSLDDIAAGKTTYLGVVNEVHLELKQSLETLVYTLSESDFPCPKCKAPLRRINGKHGFFWGCVRFKEGCKGTRRDRNGKPS